MDKIALRHSRTMMINCLPIIRSHLANLHSSLNACEKSLMAKDLEKFATLVAENMGNNPDDPITILLYSITHPVFMAGPPTPTAGLPAVINAILSLELGEKVVSTWDNSKRRPLPMLPGMSQKNSLPRRDLRKEPRNLRECPSAPE